MPIPLPHDFKRSIAGPEEAGVYQVRDRRTGELILFGISGTVKKRLKSLMPAPYGSGTRKNGGKRAYVLAHYADLDYRTLATPTRADAADVERQLKDDRNHRFNT